MSVVVEPVEATDLPALFTLLEKSGLPQEGLSEHVSTTLVAREHQDIVGSAALLHLVRPATESTRSSLLHGHWLLVRDGYAM
jgi:hypothetical protein